MAGGGEGGEAEEGAVEEESTTPWYIYSRRVQEPTQLKCVDQTSEAPGDHLFLITKISPSSEIPATSTMRSSDHFVEYNVSHNTRPMPFEEAAAKIYIRLIERFIR